MLHISKKAQGSVQQILKGNYYNVGSRIFLPHISLMGMIVMTSEVLEIASAE
jgi:hypothetical protein